MGLFGESDAPIHALPFVNQRLEGIVANEGTTMVTVSVAVGAQGYYAVRSGVRRFASPDSRLLSPLRSSFSSTSYCELQPQSPHTGGSETTTEMPGRQRKLKSGSTTS